RPAEQRGCSGYRGRYGGPSDGEVAHEVVPDREERGAREGIDEAEAVEMRRAVALARELDASCDDEHGSDEERRANRFGEEEEGRGESEPDCGYAASSAPSGVGRPRANSGTKIWASGPIASA